MFRIPGYLNETFFGEKPVVMMQHGLLDSSDTFITNDPNLAPGLTLARAGFDVWFGNNRGNKYSIGHKTLKTNSDEFWAFSW